MANDFPLEQIMADCCGSCGFFINHSARPWCMHRFKTGGLEDPAYVKNYYVCHRYYRMREETAIASADSKQFKRM